MDYHWVDLYLNNPIDFFRGSALEGVLGAMSLAASDNRFNSCLSV
jgi:hypothetical protein